MAAKFFAIDIELSIACELTTLFATAILAYPPQPIEGALEAVRAAAQRGPVGLISDTGVSPGSSLRHLMSRFGFARYFSTLTFSDEVGVSKPQRPMFEITAQRLGVDPADLFHIGDLDHTDIAGAKGVGAKAALFTGDNTSSLGNHHHADYIFRSWREFLETLPSIE